MIGVFKKKNPGNIVMLFIIGILLKLPVFLSSPSAVVNSYDGILYKKIIRLLEPIGAALPIIYSVIAFIIIFFQAIILCQFINANRLMQKPNFLSGLAYILITSFVPEFNVLSSQLIISVFYLLIFIQLFKAYNQQLTNGAIYNSGLILGIATLFFFPATTFLVWMFIAFIMLRPFKLKEWLLIILGVLTPYYFLAAYIFLTDQSFYLLMPKLTFGFERKIPSIWLAGALFLVLAPLLTGIYYSQSLSGRMLIHMRKAWTLFLWYIVICMVSIFFNRSQGYENWVMVMLPVAAFHGFGYLNAEVKIYPKIAFWLAVMFIIASQLLSGMW